VQRWLFARELEKLNAERVYYLDECGIEHRLFRLRARAPRGQKIEQRVSGSLRKRSSVIGTWKQGRLVASMVFEGACNASVMEAYFQSVLLPALPVGSVVVLDNARFHQGARLGELARERGVELMYLPAYSPDLNPIEHFWAVLKNALRPLLPLSKNPANCILKVCKCYY
jgi:transposase